MDVSYPVINFYPAYFNTRDFAKAVDDNKNVKITESSTWSTINQTLVGQHPEYVHTG